MRWIAPESHRILEVKKFMLNSSLHNSWRCIFGERSKQVFELCFVRDENSSPDCSVNFMRSWLDLQSPNLKELHPSYWPLRRNIHHLFLSHISIMMYIFNFAYSSKHFELLHKKEYWALSSKNNFFYLQTIGSVTTLCRTELARRKFWGLWEVVTHLGWPD